MHNNKDQDCIYVGGQLPIDENGNVLFYGDIANQTRAVFENMKAVLYQNGMTFHNLVNLNTYYVYKGPEEEATQYWEKMTKVRLEYFPDPGPAATAVRVNGMPYDGCLIQIEGIAIKSHLMQSRQRIMPADSWDWSIPIPLSQGWRVNNRIFVGGQISADENGKAVYVNNIDAQINNVLKFIERVLEDGGAKFSDIVRIKICYNHDGDDTKAKSLISNVIRHINDKINDAKLSVTAFGVNLLYEGLVLEIDGEAVINDDVQSISSQTPLMPEIYSSNFTPAIKTTDNLYISGLASVDSNNKVTSHSHLEQLEVIVENLKRILIANELPIDNIEKINLLYLADGDSAYLRKLYTDMIDMLRTNLGSNMPSITAVRVNDLPLTDSLVQLDGIATTIRY